jgi:glycosyltransferase involved in cell wall biosynthesis
MVSPMETKKAPYVSILLPTYNRSALLRKALESVFAQTFSDWELIILDDGSTDETVSITLEYKKRDPRMKIIRSQKNENRGIAELLNRGLAAARGKYIARLDDDDHWIDDKKLEKQYAFLEENPGCVIVGGGVVVVDGEGKERFRYFKKETDSDIRANALFANPFSHTTVMFRRAVAEKVGGYGTWRFAEDWDLWLRMGKLGTLYNFPEYFTAYRMTEQSGSFIHQRGQSRMILTFIALHRHEYPGFYKAYLLNGAQYLFSFVPISIRKPLHSFLVAIKRKVF